MGTKDSQSGSGRFKVRGFAIKLVLLAALLLGAPSPHGRPTAADQASWPRASAVARDNRLTPEETTQWPGACAGLSRRRSKRRLRRGSRPLVYSLTTVCVVSALILMALVARHPAR
jgi:hypothetical protein